ncbi:MAG: D-2-hydroxyacid dehydrogenase [Planctomycetes bacterium]|nr:D-2-hydroxyacid dehydrogenase [Planctomycetota bacterium]
MNDSSTRALLIHSEPDALLPFLRARCTDLDWHAADTPERVVSAVADQSPEVVLSIKHNELPGPAHVPAIRCESVRWFHVGGSGRDHLGAWDPARVTVTTSAGVLAPFLAERAMAGLLALTTGIPAFLRAQQARSWEPSTFRALAGRTALVIGVGHTGGELARRLRAFDVRVLGLRSSGRPHDAVDEMHEPSALNELLPRADVVSLHVPSNDTTHHLIGADELSRLPSAAIVLNAARGDVVDTTALVDSLDRGHLAGAWLDVFEHEPLPSEDPLWARRDVLITPHCADQVEGWPMRFAERFATNWERFRRGEQLIGVVRPA